MPEIPIPESIGEVTAGWLSAALPAGFLDGATVTDVAHEPIAYGEGFTGSLARLRVTTDPPGRVPTLIAKLPTTHGVTHELMRGIGGYEKEVRFYREFASRVSLPAPACHVAEYDPETGRFVLILEDMAPAESGDQVKGATVEETDHVIDALAEFHAAWWNNEDIAAKKWLLPPEGIGDDLLRMFDEGMPAVQELWGAQYPDLVKLIGKTRGMLSDLFDMFAAGELPRPYTLVHGDMRLDNLFFPTGEGGRFAVVDWQGFALGSPTNDLAYWLAVSLPVEVRRQHEERLLRRYHRRLVQHGVEGYSLGALKRAHQGTAVILLGLAPVLAENLDLSSPRGQALMAAAGERIDAAARDRHAARLVLVLPWLLKAVRLRLAAGRTIGNVRRRVGL